MESTEDTDFYIDILVIVANLSFLLLNSSNFSGVFKRNQQHLAVVTITVLSIMFKIVSITISGQQRSPPQTLLHYCASSVTCWSTLQLLLPSIKKKSVPATFLSLLIFFCLILENIKLFQSQSQTISSFSYSLIFLRYSLVVGIPGHLLLASSEGTLFNFEIFKNEKSLLTSKPILVKYWVSILKLVSLIWPCDNFRTQLCAIFCCVLLIVGRIFRLLIPIYWKIIVDNLTGYSSQNEENLPREFCWLIIVVFIIISSSDKLVDIAHAFFWMHVEQHCNAKIQLKFFEHIHNLGHKWHLEKKPCDVLKIADLGGESLNSLVEHIFFCILPNIADILIASIYLSITFNVWMGLIVLLQVVIYLIAAVVGMEWRKELKQCVHLADEERKQMGMDSLLNFETVKYFANEIYEKKRYKEFYTKLQAQEKKLQLSGQLLDLVQTVIMNGGIIAGSLLSAWMVCTRTLTAGDYLLFFSHSSQIQSYLRYFGMYYRRMQECLVNVETMLKIFQEEPEIEYPAISAKISKGITLKEGRIEFRNVSFGYTAGNLILNKISFQVEPGKTFALVGLSGGGKSTIFKLLFRFYEPDSGDILIDGRNIREICSRTHRRFLGIVPQDSILFNNTLKYNIAYGKVEATRIELDEVAKLSHLDETILKLSEGYDTKVRERGQALSGGERLRVSIARIILENASIILLDEPTASLDTLTERKIQDSLRKLCQNKTTIVIAHKLATIVHADQILVLSNGRIVESGTHSELLQLEGLYSKLWVEQLLLK